MAWRWEAVLAQPAFWASYFELFLDDEEGDDAPAPITASACFGCSPGEAGALERELHNHEAAGREYLLRALAEAGGSVDRATDALLAANPLSGFDPHAREHERARLEAALGPAPENKVLALGQVVIEFVPAATLFHLEDARGRLLLGHLSGHHALPALRWREVLELDEALAAHPLHRFVGLLLCATAWAEPDVTSQSVTSLVARAGVMQAAAVEPFVARLLAPPELECEPRGPAFSWWRDESLGWVNNSPYGPRNPASFFSRDFTAQDGFARLAAWAPR